MLDLPVCQPWMQLQEPSLLRRNGGPLFTLGPAPAQNPLGPPLPLMCDVGELLAREWHMRMSKCHVLAQNDLDRKLASARSAKRAPVRPASHPPNAGCRDLGKLRCD